MKDRSPLGCWSHGGQERVGHDLLTYTTTKFRKITKSRKWRKEEEERDRKGENEWEE